MKEVRTLRADEIELRVGFCSEKGFTLLLYKDARVDRNILDETFGVFNWQNNFEIIDNQLFASVSIYDEDKKQWITKKDVGVESNTEKEKGRASDSFKRACFKLGIGVELYTSPFIWISGNTKKNNKGKFVSTIKNFQVSKIVYEDKKIIGLTIFGDGKKIFGNIEKNIQEEAGLEEIEEKEAKELLKLKNELNNLLNEFFKGDKEKIKEYCKKNNINKTSKKEEFVKQIKLIKGENNGNN